MRFVRMPEAGIYRAGRWSDVDTYPPPSPRISLTNRQTDGYRWEDASGQFATVKCSASSEAAIGRTIARYRKRVVDDATGGGIIDAIVGFMEEEPDSGEPELTDGTVPSDVFDDLYEIHIPGDRPLLFVDVEADETLATLQEQLSGTLDALDAGPLTTNLAREPDRRVSRLAMRALHSLCADERFGPVAGIRCAGQPDPQWEAFVMWCPPEFVDLTAEDVELRWVSQWDDDTVAAAKCLGLKLPGDDDS